MRDMILGDEAASCIDVRPYERADFIVASKNSAMNNQVDLIHSRIFSADKADASTSF